MREGTSGDTISGNKNLYLSRASLDRYLFRTTLPKFGSWLNERKEEDMLRGSFLLFEQPLLIFFLFNSNDTAAMFSHILNFYHTLQ